ncbi:MAG: hypothetical protein NT117_04155 [Gammaproteobacteria bacterium]|nr:hypothetical protein [Gammaproteobacteria bacterium]
MAVLVAQGSAANALPRFPAQAVWNRDISQDAVHPSSATMMSTLVAAGGFGYGRMQIDFSMHVVNAPADAPTRTIIGYPTPGEYYSPDCEPVGSTMPVPANAAIEGNTGLACANASDDCHLLVVQGNNLYEAYRANASGGSGLQSQCLALWKLDFVYPDDNRGDHCTSADAAGFPIAPLLFNADEVFAAMQGVEGDLGHALRFILPNARMASASGIKFYVRPASHAGGPSGPEASVPYGSRLRLRRDFPVHLYPASARVVLRTMQRYGIVLADGGNIALTAESDLFTTHTWAELGINSRVFDQAVPSAPVLAQDFVVLDTGPRIVETYDCVRNPPMLAVAGASASEGNAGTKVFDFVVKASEPGAGPISFDIFTENGSAASGSDYASNAIIGKTIPAGQASTTFAVTVNGDTAIESHETFTVNLANPSSATISLAQAQGRIVNDDLPSLSIADASVTEGNSGIVTATFVVQLSAPASAPVSFDVATGNGSAQAGSDYQARVQAGRIIDPGRTRVLFEVAVQGDALVESTETFSVTVGNVAGATLLDGAATGSIGNDDSPAVRAQAIKGKASGKRSPQVKRDDP